MANPGLETLDTPAEAPEAGAIQTTAPKATGITGKIALDPTQTESILANMQQYIDERNSPMNLLMGGINRAYATTYGPSALTAHDQQKNLEEKQVMDYRSQMAAYRAAQAQAANEAARYQGMAPGAAPAGNAQPTAGGVPISPEQLAIENSLGTAAEKLESRRKYLGTRSTEAIKRENSPELDKLVPYAINGREELIPLREATELAKKNPNLPQNQKILVEASKVETTPSLATTGTNLGNMRPPGKSTGFQEPTTPDKDLARIDANLKSYGDKGVNTLAGVISKWSPPNENDTPALIKNASKFLGIDPNQPIDLQNPAVRQAISTAIIKQEGNLPKVFATTQTTTTATNQPTLAEIQANRKIEEERGVAGAKKYGESGEAMRTGFENDTDPGTLDDAYATSRRIQNLVKGDPTLSGVINQPSVAAAVAGVLKSGIGNFGIADLENAIYKSLPTTTQQSLGERSELISYLAKIELQTAKLIKGQGQITEGEREILQRASSSINDPAELIYKKARALERVTKMNEQLAEVYGNNASGKYNDFRKFKNEPEFKQIHKEFRKDLEDILNEKVSFAKPKAGAQVTKPAHPSDIQDIINRNKQKAQ